MEPATERKFARDEIHGHNTRKSNLIIIDNVVYDVTEFLDDHPGGCEVLLDNGGRDATRCFRDVGHSDIALEWRDKFRAGEVRAADRWPELPPPAAAPAAAPALSLASLLDAVGPPLALAALAALLYVYLF